MACLALRSWGPRRELYRWVVVALFWLVYFLNHADRQILFSVFPLVKRDLELSDLQLGLLGSTFQWVYALLVPLAGLLADAVSRKRMICGALLFWSATTAGSGLVSGFWPLLLLRGLTGAGEAFYYPAATSIISDYHGSATRALAMSIHQTSLYFGVVMSGTLAGYIGQRAGWRATFLIFGTAGLLAAALVAKVLREPSRGQAEQHWTRAGPVRIRNRMAEIFARPAPLALIICFCGMSFASVAVVTWMPTLLYREFGYSLAAAGFHATFYHQLGAFLGVLAGGWLADQWAERIRLSRPVVQAVGLVGAAPFIYWLGHASSSAAM